MPSTLIFKILFGFQILNTVHEPKVSSLYIFITKSDNFSACISDMWILVLYFTVY